jgi:hypothetical protein
MSAYLGTSLFSKLDLAPSIAGSLLHAPEGYLKMLPGWGTVLKRELSPEQDWIQAFYTEKKTLVKEFPRLKQSLKKDGQIWITWPKQSSHIETDINENIIREIGLENDLVDVKVAAIDDVWSALKFVYRVVDR